MLPLVQKPLEAGVGDTNQFLQYRLTSVFQPIFSLAHRRAVGFESLVRGARLSTNEPVSPFELFKQASRSDEVLALDRQCQRLHIQKFADQAPPDRWLFLNVDAATLNDKRYLDDYIPRAMAEAGLPFHQLVIEVVESPSVNEQALFDGVNYFRSLGALVALDDFGAGHSNFDRIWRLAPNIVKLDRSIIFEADRHSSGSLRRMLPNLVSLIHEAGSLVLVEGVETRSQALLALDADADFVQGFHLAKPQAELVEQTGAQRELLRICNDFARSQDSQEMRERRFLSPYIKAFRSVRSKFRPGSVLQSSCQDLLAMPDVISCLVFNEKGEPIEQHLSKKRSTTPDERFKPVSSTLGGSWFRRRYIRDAINQPRRVQLSRPYLSSTEGCMCVMISVANAACPRRVFGCEIAWNK